MRFSPSTLAPPQVPQRLPEDELELHARLLEVRAGERMRGNVLISPEFARRLAAHLRATKQEEESRG